MSKSIGSKIADKRVSKEMTRPQLAKRAKVSVGYLSHIEKDHIPLTTEVAKRFEKALGIKFTNSELETHNRSAKKWLKSYRARLATKNGKSKRQPVSSAQPQLPGFSKAMGGFNINELVAELVNQKLREALSAQVDDSFKVTPIFKKVK